MSTVNELLEKLPSKFTCCLNTSGKRMNQYKKLHRKKEKARQVSTFLFVNTIIKWDAVYQMQGDAYPPCYVCCSQKNEKIKDNSWPFPFKERIRRVDPPWAGGPSWVTPHSLSTLSHDPRMWNHN